jgi:hypothetical protein
LEVVGAGSLVVKTPPNHLPCPHLLLVSSSGQTDTPTCQRPSLTQCSIRQHTFQNSTLSRHQPRSGRQLPTEMRFVKSRAPIAPLRLRPVVLAAIPYHVNRVDPQGVAWAWALGAQMRWTPGLIRRFLSDTPSRACMFCACGCLCGVACTWDCWCPGMYESGSATVRQSGCVELGL